MIISFSGSQSTGICINNYMTKYHKSIITPIEELLTSKYRGIINYKDNQKINVQCYSCNNIIQTKLGWHLQAKWFRDHREYICSKCLKPAWNAAGHKAVTGCIHPNRGKTYEDIHGEDKAKLIKLKVARHGKDNAQFGKPAYTGSGNGWSGWYKDKYFRSLLELSFIINYLEKNSLEYTSAESTSYKIPYTNYEGKQRNYFADFVTSNNLIEVKPKSAVTWYVNKLKFTAAEEWCKTNNYTFKIFDNTMFKQLTNEQLILMYKDNIIKWLPRYEAKFKEKHNL